MAETYAIVESGGKQYRAEKGAKLLVDRIAAGEGDKVALRPVMFRGDGDVVLDGGDLEKVKVEAVVAEHLRGRKIRVFKYRPKKGYRRRAGHRSELTRLEVTDVKLLTRKPAGASKAAEKEKPEPKRKAATTKPAKAGAATKKPAAAKKPAAKKGTAKKPAATKRPAARKTSGEKKEA